MSKINHRLSKIFIAFMAVGSQVLMASPADPPQLPDAADRAAERSSLDERFGRVAKEAPNFGGMFYDENGDLNVYLVDPNDHDTAKAALEKQFGAKRLYEEPAIDHAKAKRRLPPGQIPVLQAQYRFDELNQLS